MIENPYALAALFILGVPAAIALVYFVTGPHGGGKK